MKLSLWQQEKLKDALGHLNAIVDKAQGKEGARCGCSKEACEELESYLTSWVIPPVQDVIEGNK